MAEGDIDYEHFRRFQSVAIATSISMEQEMEESIVIGGIRRPRSHDLWMFSYLYARTDPTQNNTLCKLELDFLRLGYPGVFRRSTRMPPSVYKELLEKVRPLITYADTNYRKSVKAEERLSLTIRYLTRGDSVDTLALGYRVGKSSVLKIVHDTCRAIFKVLEPEYMQVPKTPEGWQHISKQFHDRWNMPHVVGSIDGKHIRITKPRNTGSLYYNYKGFFSIVLFACVDAEYRFMYVDVGAEGRASDSTLWRFSPFCSDLYHKKNPLQLPAPCPIPGYKGNLPYYFVGDDAFKMSVNLMKPYPLRRLTMKQRIFNYRLSRARRIVENAFGILATRFRILRREIEMNPKNATAVVLTCVILHNFLREKAAAAYIPKEATDWEDRDYNQHRGVWRGEPVLPSGAPTTARNRSQTVKDQRDALADWCVTREGELPYQYNVLLNTEFFFER